MATTRKEPLTTIAISKVVGDQLEDYLSGKNMSKKDFVEKSVAYFLRNGFDLNDNISILTPVQELIAEVRTQQEEQARQQAEQNKVMFAFFQSLTGLKTLQNSIERKALPELSTATEYKTAYNRAKKAIRKLCDNNKYSVRISRIKNILDEYFDI